MGSKGLLFDFDGTLYGDWKLWVSLILATLEDFGVSVSSGGVLAKVREMISEHVFYNISGVAISIAEEQGVGLNVEIRERFLEKLDRVMDETGIERDTVRVLDMLREKEVRMGIVSFQRRPRLERRLDAWKLKDYFATVVTPEEFSAFKPSPQPFLAAMKDINLEPSQCYVVGDEPVDMIGGKKAGAMSVGLPKGFFSEHELRQAGADFIIRSITALPPLLGQ